MDNFDVNSTIICKGGHFAFAIDENCMIMPNEFLDVESGSTGVYKGTIPNNSNSIPTGEMANQIRAISKDELEIVEIDGIMYATDIEKWQGYTESKIIEDEYNRILQQFQESSHMTAPAQPIKQETVEPTPSKPKVNPFKKQYEILKRYIELLGIKEEDAKNAVVEEKIKEIAIKYSEIGHVECKDDMVRIIFNIVEHTEEFMKDIEDLK